MFGINNPLSPDAATLTFIVAFLFESVESWDRIGDGVGADDFLAITIFGLVLSLPLSSVAEDCFVRSLFCGYSGFTPERVANVNPVSSRILSWGGVELLGISSFCEEMEAKLLPQSNKSGKKRNTSGKHIRKTNQKQIRLDGRPLLHGLALIRPYIDHSSPIDRSEVAPTSPYDSHMIPI